MQRSFRIIGAVSILALIAAVTVSLADAIGSLPDKQLCWFALNPDTLSAWDQSSHYSGYVAEVQRRGLTVDACRQVIGKSGSRSSPVKAETSFLEAATFFLTGVDATSDEIVSERDVVLRKYPLVVYLVDDKPCVRVTLATDAHRLWQLGDTAGDPSRLVFGEQLGRQSPAGLVLENLRALKHKQHVLIAGA